MLQLKDRINRRTFMKILSGTSLMIAVGTMLGCLPRPPKPPLPRPQTSQAIWQGKEKKSPLILAKTVKKGDLIGLEDGSTAYIVGIFDNKIVLNLDGVNKTYSARFV